MSGQAEVPLGESDLYLVRLIDGSQANLGLLTKEIQITTEYGKLKVPIADIRRIDVGFRYPEGAEKRIDAAVARLGDADLKVREAVGKELLGWKELAYPALARAMKNKDPEIKRRATALVQELADKLPREQLKLQEEDVIFTTRFPITGRIEGLTLKVKSPVLGEVQLGLAAIRQMRSLAGESETARELLEQFRADVPWGLTNLSSDPSVYEVRLADGSLVNMRLLSKEIEITTIDGNVKVPVADVCCIDVGFRYPEGVRKRIERAVARLGDPDFQVREAAGKELLRFKGLAYPALQKATKSKDPEVKRRATALVHELEEKMSGELELHEQDTIFTTKSSIAGKIAGQSLRLQSQFFGEVGLGLVDLRRLRSLKVERALLERVGEAVREDRTTQTNKMGTGKDAYAEVPKEGALLIGFEVTYGKFGNNPTVTTFRPIFLTRTGRVMGTTHGIPGEGLIRVQAKPGYAVGAVTIKAGLGVDGMSVTFMEIREGGLNPNRAYESEWLGGMGGGPKTKVVGTGAPVVGIFGATAEGTSTFNGLGLVTALQQKSPLQEDSPEGNRLGKVADLTREYAKVHNQKMPKEIQELRQWAIKEGKATEADFVSTRDHEPYGLSTGMGPGMVLVYEQTGKRGKRFVFLMGKVVELPSTEVDDKIKGFSGTRLELKK
jgi:hypothetical protein